MHLKTSQTKAACSYSILCVVDSFHDGGAEMFAIRLANSLCENHKVHLLEYDGTASKKPKQVQHILPTIHIYSPEKHKLVRFIRFIQKICPRRMTSAVKKIKYCVKRAVIRRYIRRHNISIIHSHAIECNSCLAEIKPLLINVRLVYTLHGHYEIYRQRYGRVRFAAMMEKHIRAVDKVIYLTKQQLTMFQEFGLPSSKAVMIWNGVEKNRENHEKCLSLKEDGFFTVALISRAVREKGWEQAVEAVSRLNQEGHRVQLLLVGDGPMVSELKAKELSHYICIVGGVSDVFPYIEASDLGLLPTYSTEGLPNFISECLICGKSVIATDMGNIHDMLKYDGEFAGEIIPAKSGTPVAPEVITNALRKYVLDDQYATHKSEIARMAAKKFCMKTCVNKYLEVYKSALL